MDMRKVVGLNVLRLRRERGISQEELSFRSGFGRAYLSGLETGKRNPTIVSLWEIASALDAKPVDLLQELPPDLPACDKDLLILSAAFDGNIDRYARLRRPIFVENEHRCVLRGICESSLADSSAALCPRCFPCANDSYRPQLDLCTVVEDAAVARRA